MLKVKFDEKLAAVKEKLQQDTSEIDAIQEVKLLMDSSSAEDMQILRGLGRDHVLLQAEKEQGKKMELEKFDEDFDGQVYTVDQIKQLAIDYNLRFLNSTYFTGKYDVQVLAKIKEFAKKTGAEINDATLKYKFFILAPEEHFALQNKIVLTKSQIRAMQDPVMFYQIDDSHYKLIHKWGSDFTVFRLVEGFKWRSYWANFLCHFVLGFALMTIFMSLLFPTTWKYYMGGWFETLNVVLALIYARVCTWNYSDDFEEESRYFSHAKWNTTDKIRRS